MLIIVCVRSDSLVAGTASVQLSYVDLLHCDYPLHLDLCPYGDHLSSEPSPSAPSWLRPLFEPVWNSSDRFVGQSECRRILGR